MDKINLSDVLTPGALEKLKHHLKDPTTGITFQVDKFYVDPTTIESQAPQPIAHQDDHTMYSAYRKIAVEELYQNMHTTWTGTKMAEPTNAGATVINLDTKKTHVLSFPVLEDYGEGGGLFENDDGLGGLLGDYLPHPPNAGQSLQEHAFIDKYFDKSSTASSLPVPHDFFNSSLFDDFELFAGSDATDAASSLPAVDYDSFNAFEMVAGSDATSAAVSSQPITPASNTTLPTMNTTCVFCDAKIETNADYGDHFAKHMKWTNATVLDCLSIAKFPQEYQKRVRTNEYSLGAYITRKAISFADHYFGKGTTLVKVEEQITICETSSQRWVRCTEIGEPYTNALDTKYSNTVKWPGNLSKYFTGKEYTNKVVLAVFIKMLKESLTDVSPKNESQYYYKLWSLQNGIEEKKFRKRPPKQKKK